MSDLYRDFIDQKADQIINSLGGTITPAPPNELYRDFLDRKFDDVITAITNMAKGGVLSGDTVPTNSEGDNNDLYVLYDSSYNVVSIYVKLNDTWHTVSTTGSTHIYSTTEHVVGTWIDGTPVYEKTIELNNISGNTYISPALNLNINAVVDFFPYIQLGYEGGYQWVTPPIYESATYHIFCHYQSADDKIYIKSRWGVASAIITIRYSKTTN